MTDDELNRAREAYFAAERLGNLAFNLKQFDKPPSAEDWERFRKLLELNQKDWDAGKDLLLNLVRSAG